MKKSMAIEECEIEKGGNQNFGNTKICGDRKR